MFEEDNFDFQSISEEPEEYTGRRVKCPHCGGMIYSDSLRCLYCGEAIYVGGREKVKWSKLIFAAVIFLVIITFLLQLI